CLPLSPTSPSTVASSTLALPDALPISSAPLEQSFQPSWHPLTHSPASQVAVPFPWAAWHERPHSPQFVTLCPLGLPTVRSTQDRSEEHTSELQSRENIVCRLLLEKKKP